MGKPSSLVLVPARIEDVACLVDIELAAFRDETANQKLSYRDALNPTHRLRMFNAYSELFGNVCVEPRPSKAPDRSRPDSGVEFDTIVPDIRILKIVDTTTGQIVAFSKTETSALFPEHIDGSIRNNHEDEPQVNREWFALNERLRRQYNCARQHCYFGMLATHPAHQRRGAGTMLLEHILAEADSANVDIYLEATARGRPLYERHGFEAVNELVFDAADYGVDGVGVERQTIMVRAARGQKVLSWNEATAATGVSTNHFVEA